MSKKKIDTVIDIWNAIREETRKRVKAEPVLASFFHSTIDFSRFRIKKQRDEISDD